MLGGGGLLVRVPPPSAWRATSCYTFARRRRSGQPLGQRDAVAGLQLAGRGAVGDVREHGGQHLVVVRQAAGRAFFGGHQVAIGRILVDVDDPERCREFRHHDHFGLRDAFRRGDLGLDRRLLEGVVMPVLAHEYLLGRRAEEVRDRAERLALVVDHRHRLVDVAEVRRRRRVEGHRDLAAGIDVGRQGMGRRESAARGEDEGNGQRDGLHLVHLYFSRVGWCRRSETVVSRQRVAG